MSITDRVLRIRNSRHIGDGVYVSFDGYHINIAVNQHDHHVVSLEPSVVTSLEDYINEVRRVVQDVEDGLS